MAEKRKGGKNDQYKDDLHDLLAQLGALGDYSDLIDAAIRQSWSITQFETNLRRSRPFQKEFRGLVGKNGHFLRQFEDAGVTSLAEGIRAYKQMKDAYTDAARAFGVPVRGAKLEMLMNSEVSPDEFATRISAVQSVRSNPGLKDAFNEQLKASGQKPLDNVGFFKFVARAGQRAFYDTYQAAYLRNAGLDLTTEQAGQVARGMDSPLKPNMDLGALVAEIRRIKPDIGPELAQAGINDADLVLLAAGQDPKGKAPLLEQITNQRRAKARGGVGTYAQQSSTGGLSIYDEEEPGSY